MLLRQPWRGFPMNVMHVGDGEIFQDLRQSLLADSTVSSVAQGKFDPVALSGHHYS